MAGSDEAGEAIAALFNDIAVGNILKRPGTSFAVRVAEELGNHIHRLFFRETHYLKENGCFRLRLPRGDTFDEFGFRLAYIDMGCPAEEPGNGAEVIEVVMRDKEIGTFQVQAKVFYRLLHYFVADRMGHSRIDYEIPVAVDDYI